jgi:hypothetical protein
MKSYLPIGEESSSHRKESKREKVKERLGHVGAFVTGQFNFNPCDSWHHNCPLLIILSTFFHL